MVIAGSYSVCRDSTLAVAAQMSAQLRSLVMQRRRWATISSPRQASAQAAHAWPHSRQARMQAARSSTSKAIGLGVERSMSSTVSKRCSSPRWPSAAPYPSVGAPYRNVVAQVRIYAVHPSLLVPHQDASVELDDASAHGVDDARVVGGHLFGDVERKVLQRHDAALVGLRHVAKADHSGRVLRQSVRVGSVPRSGRVLDTRWTDACRGPAQNYRMKFRTAMPREVCPGATGGRFRLRPEHGTLAVGGRPLSNARQHPRSQAPRARRGSLRMIVAGLIAGAAIGLVAPAANADARAASPAAAQFEVEFLEMMIDHHQMALHMSDLCLERAVSEDLVALCGRIAESQAAEIEQMQGWLIDWYGIEHEPMMDDPRHHEQMMELEMLSGSEEFEIAFLQMMSEHHAMAVEDGTECLRRAEHRDLRSLCRQIVVTQLREIAQMERWLCRWYGDCRFTYLRRA